MDEFWQIDGRTFNLNHVVMFDDNGTRIIVVMDVGDAASGQLMKLIFQEEEAVALRSMLTNARIITAQNAMRKGRPM